MDLSNVFKPIRELLPWYREKVQTAKPNPYEIDEKQLARLRSLWLDPDFQEVYIPLIDVAITLQSEGLLREPPENVERTIGRIWGLREAVILVDRILRAEEKSQDVQRKRDAAGDARLTAAVGGTFGGPHWSGSP